MNIVIFDIEASCEDWNVNPSYNMETIEIGAVKIKNGLIIDEFSTFIKPEYVVKLTDYCTELTGITFEDIESAPGFNEAILDFYEFIYGNEIYSCGKFDKKFLIRELNDKGENHQHQLAKNLINSAHRDLKSFFSQVTGKKKKGMLGMLEDLNIELEGTHHRALSDARNLTKIFIKLEKIRKEKLEKVFNEKSMEKIIKGINEEHSSQYKIVKNKDAYIITHNDEESTLDLLEFLDNWSDIILIDVNERNLNYINNIELKTLKHYIRPTT